LLESGVGVSFNKKKEKPQQTIQIVVVNKPGFLQGKEIGIAHAAEGSRGTIISPEAQEHNPGTQAQGSQEEIQDLHPQPGYPRQPAVGKIKRRKLKEGDQHILGINGPQMEEETEGKPQPPEAYLFPWALLLQPLPQ